MSTAGTRYRPITGRWPLVWAFLDAIVLARRSVLETVRGCGRKLGLDLRWEASGGVSDGNKLAAAGLPNVDTLGAVGGNIHSPEEFLILDSLVERSRLTALLLMELGSGESPLRAALGNGDANGNQAAKGN